jgi:hypothetical protein
MIQVAWLDQVHVRLIYVCAFATCRVYKVFYYIQIHLPIADAVRWLTVQPSA